MNIRDKIKAAKATEARKEVYERIYPKVKRALENGDYEFTSKNSIRIWTLDIKKEDLGNEATIRTIEVSWL